jgi:hypothetical protein
MRFATEYGDFEQALSNCLKFFLAGEISKNHKNQKE